VPLVPPRFLDPSPESTESVRESVQAIRPPEDLARWFGKYSAGQGRRLAVDLDIVDAYVPAGARIVELGAVPLIFTLALSRRGYDVTGVDLDPSRFAGTIAENHLTIVACDIETEPLPFPDASFDVLIINEVLEHLRVNPVFTLREAHRVLRPDGIMLLSTPNLRSLNGLWNLLVHGSSYAQADNVYDEYRKLERLGHVGHVREYAPGDVKTLLARLGFEVEDLVFRRRQRRALAELVCRVRPSLRVDVSYVARAAGSGDLLAQG
jgi:SAM-dependent methyltransferase